MILITWYNGFRFVNFIFKENYVIQKGMGKK